MAVKNSLVRVIEIETVVHQWLHL